MGNNHSLPLTPIWHSMRQTFAWKQDTCSRFICKFCIKLFKLKLGMLSVTKVDQVVIKGKCAALIAM